VADDLHVVAQAEIHQGVGGTEVVSVRPFPRVDELPLHVVLGRDLVEVFLEVRHVPRILPGVATKARAAGHHAPVHCRADWKVIFENFLQRGGGFDSANRRRNGEHENHEQAGSKVMA
jgi:hypothetical protein